MNLNLFAQFWPKIFFSNIQFKVVAFIKPAQSSLVAHSTLAFKNGTLKPLPQLNTWPCDIAT